MLQAGRAGHGLHTAGAVFTQGQHVGVSHKGSTVLHKGSMGSGFTSSHGPLMPRFPAVGANRRP